MRVGIYERCERLLFEPHFPFEVLVMSFSIGFLMDANCTLNYPCSGFTCSWLSGKGLQNLSFSASFGVPAEILPNPWMSSRNGPHKKIQLITLPRCLTGHDAKMAACLTQHMQFELENGGRATYVTFTSIWSSAMLTAPKFVFASAVYKSLQQTENLADLIAVPENVQTFSGVCCALVSLHHIFNGKLQRYWAPTDGFRGHWSPSSRESS